jgi:hypothetical protein
MSDAYVKSCLHLVQRELRNRSEAGTQSHSPLLVNRWVVSSSRVADPNNVPTLQLTVRPSNADHQWKEDPRA